LIWGNIDFVGSDVVGNRGRETDGIDHRHILQMNGQSIAVGAGLYGAVWNFDDPEKTVWRRPRTEVMNLLNERPRTGVIRPEVDSYLHKSAVRTC
jgi:hypothetical protein